MLEFVLNCFLFLIGVAILGLAIVVIVAVIEAICLEIAKRLERKGEVRAIYCGTQEQAEFCQEIISAIGVDINYRLVEIDGEWEVILND